MPGECCVQTGGPDGRRGDQPQLPPLGHSGVHSRETYFPADFNMSPGSGYLRGSVACPQPPEVSPLPTGQSGVAWGWGCPAHLPVPGGGDGELRPGELCAAELGQPAGSPYMLAPPPQTPRFAQHVSTQVSSLLWGFIFPWSSPVPTESCVYLQ